MTKYLHSKTLSHGQLREGGGEEVYATKTVENYMSKGRKFWGKTQSLGQAKTAFQGSDTFLKEGKFLTSHVGDWSGKMDRCFENSLSRDVLHFPHINTISEKK